MNSLNTIALMAAAYLAIFITACSSVPAQWIGARVDPLPALMVYAGLTAGLFTITTLAILAALWFDALSLNPLGISVLPLFMIGYAVYYTRSLILRKETYAQFVLGFLASAAMPLMTLFLMLCTGKKPLLGLGSVWQWFVLALGGGLLAPLFFWLFQRFQRAFSYQPLPDPLHRQDREIIRGRH